MAWLSPCILQSTIAEQSVTNLGPVSEKGSVIELIFILSGPCVASSFNITVDNQDNDHLLPHSSTNRIAFYGPVNNVTSSFKILGAVFRFAECGPQTCSRGWI